MKDFEKISTRIIIYIVALPHHLVPLFRIQGLRTAWFWYPLCRNPNGAHRNHNQATYCIYSKAFGRDINSALVGSRYELCL